MAPDEPPSPWKSVGEVAQIGMTLVVATVIGLAGGWYLDRWLGTMPWLSLGGVLFGIAAGFVNIFRTVRALGRDEKNDG
jgi:ATP synthase protein I